MIKKLLIGLLSMTCGIAYAADTKISALPSTTTLNAADIVPVVTTPGGTPANFSITKDNLRATLGFPTVATDTTTIDTARNATAVATGTLRSDMNNGFANVATSTATIFTRFLTIETDTTSIQAVLNAVAASTLATLGRLNNLDTSTGTINTQIGTVGASTGTLAFNVARDTSSVGAVANSKLGVSSITATVPVLYSNGVISFSQQVAQHETFTSSVTVNGILGLNVSFGIVAATITVSTITINSSMTVNNVSNFSFRDSHISSTGTAPSLSSCGSGPIVFGTDLAFTITGGTGSNGCTATFALPFSNTPTCAVSQQSLSVVNALTYTTTNTAITISQTGLGTNKLDIQCVGHD